MTKISKLKSNIMKAIIGSHPETGAVVTEFTSKDGNKLGRIRVDQMAQSTKNGYLSFAKRSAFIVIGTDQLENAKKFLSEGDEYLSAGRIQRMESHTELYPGQSPKIIPAKGDEPAKAYLLNGESVFFTDTWNGDASCKDVLLTANVEVAAEVESEEEA